MTTSMLLSKRRLPGIGRRLFAGVLLAAAAVAAAFAVSRQPLLALGGALIVVVAWIAATRLTIAVGLLIASFYFDHYLSDGSGFVTPGKLIGVLAAIAWFLAWGSGRRKIVSDGLLWPLAGLAAWILVSLGTAYDLAEALLATSRYLMFFVLVFLVVQVVDGSLARARQLAVVAMFAAAGAAVFGIQAYLAGTLRSTAPIGDPNDFGFLLSVTVPINLYFIASAHRRWHKVVGLVALVVTLTAILVTFSRGAIVALLATAVWATVTGRLPVRWAALVLAGVVMTGLVIYVLNPETVSQSLQQKQYVAEANVDSRLTAWRVAVAEFSTSPVFGVGPGNYEERFGEFGRPADHRRTSITTHNAYLNILAELGLVGVILFVIYLVLAWSRLRRRFPEDPDTDELQSALAAGFVVALVGSMFLTQQYYAPIWLLPALGGTLVRTRQRSAIAFLGSRR